MSPILDVFQLSQESLNRFFSQFDTKRPILWNKIFFFPQLRFNLDVLTHPTNLAAQYTNPSPILIEKISTPHNKSAGSLAAEDLLRNSCSSVSFSVVSEERLNLAVQLAKRDVRRKHLRESKAQPHPTYKIKTAVTSNNPDKVRRKPPSKERTANGSIKHEVTRSGARVYVYTPDRGRIDMGVSDSPPTRDPGPGDGPKKGMDPSEHEVRRLQRELHTYMQKIEELAKKGKNGLHFAGFYGAFMFYREV